MGLRKDRDFCLIIFCRSAEISLMRRFPVQIASVSGMQIVAASRLFFFPQPLTTFSIHYQSWYYFVTL